MLINQGFWYFPLCSVDRGNPFSVPVLFLPKIGEAEFKAVSLVAS
jgi:hypothetical protein